MKSLLRSSIVCAAAVLPLAAGAQGAKPEPDYTLSGNLAIGSDYRFRGFSQTDYQPTIQGGVDFAHKSGFYLGNWNSNVSSKLYNGAPIEMDFYGGWKTSFEGFGLDVGVIYYYYPGTGEVSPGVDAKNFEAYIGGSFGPVSLKYFYSFTDFFGLNSGALALPGDIDTKGSQYLDLTGTFDVGSGFGIVAHAGYQYVKNNEKLGGPSDNVWDYKLGGTWDIMGSGWVLGAFWVGTSEKNFFLTAENPPRGAGKSSFLATVSKTF
ncbi:MAG: hypothetical protein H6R03_1561 [Burkholderiaceae bacterium]|nr:hypothetical protein [Burkholderiaceae bacterium]